MARTVSIVTYHFVRTPDRSPFPRIKARRTDEFRTQVELIRQRCHPISVEDLLAALADPAVELPERAVVLTFDDGYADHHRTAAPILTDLGLRAAFFVPAMPVVERTVLQVNKIQFVLAAATEDEVLRRVLAEIDAHRPAAGIPDPRPLWDANAVANRFDTAGVRFVKQTLQSALPRDVREDIVDRLFAQLVTADESAFAEELYMGADDVRALRDAGMAIGAHGWAHQWMDTLAPGDQQREIDLSRRFLRSLGVAEDPWTMCYPYGRWDSSLVDLLAADDCAAAFTVEPRIADLDRDAALRLPRLDTNDLPVRR
ncbi:polysaccharide deacetylase family protein [Actinomycetospora aeridis]|uniref:Polysaccharide deacetylase family protein n=1 Tax=Actinomycetospora aeridis TaxID=3129231 RepID=A0ABU8N673_9PSEU